MTRYARTKGKKGTKTGRTTTMGFKKKIKRKKITLPKTVVQTYYSCSNLCLNLHPLQKIGVLTRRDKTYSYASLGTRNASLVVFDVNATEQHWDPAKYQAGTQYIGDHAALPNPPSGQMPDPPVWYVNSADGTALAPRPDGLDAAAPVGRSIMTTNGTPESNQVRSTPNNQGVIQSVPWNCPNSILKSISINMTLSACTPFDQILSVKLVRNSTPTPELAGDMLSSVNMRPLMQEMCNRQRDTNGQYLQTIWSTTFKIKGLKTGAQPIERKIKKTLNLGYSRSAFRKINSAQHQLLIGSQALPTYVEEDTGFFNGCYIVISAMMQDEEYVAHVTRPQAGGIITTGTSVPDAANPGTMITNEKTVDTRTIESIPLRAGAGVFMAPLNPDPPFIPVPGVPPTVDQNRYKNPPIGAQFRYGGNITVTHKVTAMTRGLDSASIAALSNLQQQIHKLGLKPTVIEVDDDLEIGPDASIHAPQGETEPFQQL
ncbi:MAG TPA: hypothetical protein EYN66_11860 [Myxococcales bacterium]|nr:hypothetical protein [Myxococcales bacterium]